MTYHTPFSAQDPSPSATLPLTLISLDDWGIVTTIGADAKKYLQGQVTTDLTFLNDNQHVLTAHCDAKGKMWSNLRLFQRGEGFAYIERRSLLETQLTELKKYAVFSKVTLAKDEANILLGVAGTGSREALTPLFPTLPDTESPVIQHEATTLLHFALPAERFLIVTDKTTAAKLTETLIATCQPQLNDSQQWLALEIEAGFPVIDAASSAQFIPQATNLQAIENSICFKKGCYTGQEMVARAKYRGANKRAMYWLAGNATSLPAVGDDLEWQLGEKWRRTGSVLAAVKLVDGSIWVQVVMNNDMEAGSVFRIRDDEGSALTIQTLPYSLDEEK
ncbi:tRNA-modifying protein YgfZ [Xenorhabdus griffiniae]|uniref:tRNA-modifying protein YgfZ n=1 Tax=Xenorhabdus griffiniae TaxID=351672 RepID=A0ABY9XKJ0_9GAMM|nr:tRNA-modifying protein YgfZ [Xenorhabdus griffiniae]MBD1228488.1 tRNA-modifying protein YgfZ [Xenorhabdus griffiniae]MBE8588070.1 tRNA-modifying protein YgfZ [Xenorhabdus griffiniae]WMV73345.1 tRNA-modifying protein YgfZ [Xenorhabdus griffiniae]WNH03024.1 tRNA-modifying protein YgfZ [Xenorhabdus griffiniae]